MAGISDYQDQGLDDDDYDDFDNSQRLHSSYQYNYPIENFNNYYQTSSRGELTLNLQKTPTASSFKSYQQTNFYDSPESEEVSLRRYLSHSISLVSLITENIISHPFIVLRRQSQVYQNSKHYHIHPARLFPVVCHLYARQGISALFKGLGSSLLVRGSLLAIEDVIDKITQWPKEINSRTTMKQFGQHLILKSISLGIVLPFYSASLVETVQSDIASEKPGLLDVFREGSSRWLAWSVPAKGRMLPVWALLPSGVCIGLSKYLFGVIIKGISTRILSRHYQNKEEKQGARSKDLSTINNEVELASNIISLITSEILFYPFETVLHRIQLQGTRTIIDNLDTGTQVVPILTSYEGAFDCYVTTIQSEGFGGLYKGFGALMLQFAAHLAVIKLSKWVFNQITEICSEKAPTKVTEFYNLEPTSISQQHGSTVSRSLSYVSSLNDEP
ncbi:hypothetical protein PVAND_003891 [Polypedilum vanderplanki]|uniref:Solute carrier family 25 member 46 n=1 Tax=Polypedilum vanderplanki TaxID=319348 RepID=A0A9J6BWI8_POLVA|nr:hypothetical protein PVAND_003891 [Polypedilum vanderplanki]